MTVRPRLGDVATLLADLPPGGDESTDPPEAGRTTRSAPLETHEYGWMDATQSLLLIAGAWIAIGVAAGIVMGRRGHNAFTWLILGAVLGPLCVPVALVAVFEERSHSRREVVHGQGRRGPVDILVGIDGSPESGAAFLRVGTLFGTRIGRLTLACVEDFDTGSGDALLSGECTARSLEQMAREVAAQNPSAVMLSGRPAEALIQYATEEGYELIAIGRRGRGPLRRC